MRLGPRDTSHVVDEWSDQQDGSGHDVTTHLTENEIECVDGSARVWVATLFLIIGSALIVLPSVGAVPISHAERTLVVGACAALGTVFVVAAAVAFVRRRAVFRPNEILRGRGVILMPRCRESMPPSAVRAIELRPERGAWAVRVELHRGRPLLAGVHAKLETARGSAGRLATWYDVPIVEWQLSDPANLGSDGNWRILVCLSGAWREEHGAEFVHLVATRRDVINGGDPET